MISYEIWDGAECLVVVLKNKNLLSKGTKAYVNRIREKSKPKGQKTKRNPLHSFVTKEKRSKNIFDET